MPFLWLENGIKITVKPPVRHKYEGNRAWRELPLTEGQMVWAFVILFAASWFCLWYAMTADLAAHNQQPVYYEVPNDPR